MTVEECYKKIGADYTNILQRLGKDERIRRFMLMFLEDPNYGMLCEAMEKKDYDAAFSAAHTLKGGCQNLSFTRLLAACSGLTDALRAGQHREAEAIYAEVCSAYEQTVLAIREL